MPRALRILGVEVDAVTREEAATSICEAVDARRGHGAAPLHVATVNPEFVMLARHDREFRHILRHAGLRTADGIGLMLAARILGSRLPARVTGVELVHDLARTAADRGDRIFLLGGGSGVAEGAARALVAVAPGLEIAGTMEGTPAESGDPEALAAIRAGRADIVLTAFGAPAQERWLDRNLALSGAAVGIGVGGTLDFLSGRVRRAPAWIRRAGFEWLYRLMTQPWRARRQAVLPVFMLLVLRQRLLGR